MRTLKPDMILHNGNFHLLNATLDVVNAVAIFHDRIAAVGGANELLPLAGPETEVIDMGGRSILPGLTDAHIHFEKYARGLGMVDCETDSLEACLEKVKGAVDNLTDNSWIVGHGWNQNRWSRFGKNADLDQISSEIPIYLTAKSLHAGWANSAALRIARIGEGSPNPPGGEIQFDSNGVPTGILFENAMRLVAEHIPAPTVNELIKLMKEAQKNLWQVGITSIHDFDGVTAFSALQLMKERDDLGLRVLKNLPVDYLSTALDLGLRSGFGDDWLWLGNIKVFADGALGPHTAAMIKPYEHEENNYGMLLLDAEEIAEIGIKARNGGFGLCVHAIGDKANHVVLNALEMLLKKTNSIGEETLRYRIEHLQLLHPDDLHRVADLGVIASMQPIHATSDMDMANQYWGDRSRYAYAWRSVLDSKAVLAFGSDAPVEEPNPFLGIHSAITRQKQDGYPGSLGWIPEEKISMQEALRAFTFNPAIAAGKERLMGRISHGYLADLIVLDENPFQLQEDQISDVSPAGTMVGGKWRVREF